MILQSLRIKLSHRAVSTVKDFYHQGQNCALRAQKNTSVPLKNSAPVAEYLIITKGKIVLASAPMKAFYNFIRGICPLYPTAGHS